MASSPESSKSRDVTELPAVSGLKRYTWSDMKISSRSVYVHTLEGRKFAMTSLTFCVGGPAGGGGALAVMEPRAMLRSRSATSWCRLTASL